MPIHWRDALVSTRPGSLGLQSLLSMTDLLPIARYHIPPLPLGIATGKRENLASPPNLFHLSARVTKTAWAVYVSSEHSIA